MPDIFTKEKRSEIMSKVRSKDTTIELKMMAALKKNNLEFQYQPKLFGKPDFLVHPNIAIFCDSSFWHGRHWSKLKLQLKEGYWREHIEKNRKRDRLVNKELKKAGYTVVRCWDDEINKNMPFCIMKIMKVQNYSRKAVLS